MKHAAWSWICSSWSVSAWLWGSHKMDPYLRVDPGKDRWATSLQSWGQFLRSLLWKPRVELALFEMLLMCVCHWGLMKTGHWGKGWWVRALEFHCQGCRRTGICFYFCMASSFNILMTDTFSTCWIILVVHNPSNSEMGYMVIDVCVCVIFLRIYMYTHTGPW